MLVYIPKDAAAQPSVGRLADRSFRFGSFRKWIVIKLQSGVFVELKLNKCFVVLVKRQWAVFRPSTLRIGGQFSKLLLKCIICEYRPSNFTWNAIDYSFYRNSYHWQTIIIFAFWCCHQNIPQQTHLQLLGFRPQIFNRSLCFLHPRWVHNPETQVCVPFSQIPYRSLDTELALQNGTNKHMDKMTKNYYSILAYCTCIASQCKRRLSK